MNEFTQVIRSRENILNEVLGHNREIERLQQYINDLYLLAQKTSDADDDKDYVEGYGYLSSIQSYYLPNH
jgi:hypothetical protein